MLDLVVEGWRFYPQSFSVVNQFQCLELLKRKDVRLYHREIPAAEPGSIQDRDPWTPDKSGLEPLAAAALESIPPPPYDLIPDATLRIFLPYDYTPAPKGRTFVFTVTGSSRVPPQLIAGNKKLEEALRSPDVVLVTPSQWSKDGIAACGIPESQIVVVPHGVDTDIFRPAEEDERRRLRREFGWDDHFIFLNVGGQFWWKNPELLLKAVAFVAKQRPKARVVLKGVDAVYPSRNALAGMGGRFTPDERSLLEGRVQYIGGTFSYARLADLYRAADALVLPYVNEGFCLPALEAMACGLPVICTAGGPTDDFLDGDVALSIESDIRPPSGSGVRMTIHAESLVRQMLRAMDDEDLAARAREAGPRQAKNWTWARAVDRLVEALSAHA